MNKPLLKVAQGLPGSGKSTEAFRWVQHYPENRVGISRDDFRRMFGVGLIAYGEQKLEEIITNLEQEAVRAALRAGKSVYLHDTNLRDRKVREWLSVAEQEGADWQVENHFMQVPLGELIRRNAERPLPESVPENQLRNKYERFAKNYNPGKVWEPVAAIGPVKGLAPYDRQSVHKDPAYIFDIDGNIASHEGIRGHHEYSRVADDEVREDVVETLVNLHEMDNAIILMTGRPESCREETEMWLDVEGIPYDHLLMRSDEEQRLGVRDDLVKLRLFDEHVRDSFSVIASFDDRDRVVQLWRDLGITCFQSAPGDF